MVAVVFNVISWILILSSRVEMDNFRYNYDVFYKASSDKQLSCKKNRVILV